MMTFARPVVALALLTSVSACMNLEKLPPVAANRETMLESARQRDPLFPDGITKKLTVFADIGQLKTTKGTYEVVDCRAVLTGMLAPRGQSWLSFHDQKGTWISSIRVEPMIRP